LVVHSGGAESAVPRSDAGGSPPRGPSALLITRGEATMQGPTGGSAAVISPTPDSGLKSSAVSLGGEIAELSGGVLRLKSRLSSPPPVPRKRQREVGSSNEEEGRATKRGRVVLSSDSDDDGATLTLLRRKRSARGGQSGGGVPPPSMLGGVPDGSGPSSVPIAPALEVCSADGEDALMAVEEGPRSPSVDDAQRDDPATEQELEALTPENVELLTTRTLTQVCHVGCFYVFSMSLINADPLLCCLTCNCPPSGLSILLASRV
ncbi:hypothetical protein PanWU01x14_079760, partial [Parasponia andersonii]